jgi:hypothetical protein
MTFSVVPPALAACPVVLAFGDELLVLPDDESEWISPGGRDLAALYLLPRAETALRQELQRLADAAKRAREGQSASSSGSRGGSWLNPGCVVMSRPEGLLASKGEDRLERQS